MDLVDCEAAGRIATGLRREFMDATMSAMVDPADALDRFAAQCALDECGDGCELAQHILPVGFLAIASSTDGAIGRVTVNTEQRGLHETDSRRITSSETDEVSGGGSVGISAPANVFRGDVHYSSGSIDTRSDEQLDGSVSAHEQTQETRESSSVLAAPGEGKTRIAAEINALRRCARTANRCSVDVVYSADNGRLAPPATDLIAQVVRAGPDSGISAEEKAPLLQELLSYGFQPSVDALNGAVAMGEPLLADFLYSYFGTVDVQDSSRHTALWRAMEEKQYAMFDWLARRGANLELRQPYHGPVELALLWHHDPQAARDAIRSGRGYVEVEETVLNALIIDGDHFGMQVVLVAGASPSGEDPFSRPLHRIAAVGNTRALRVLESFIADDRGAAAYDPIDLRDFNGNTALGIAAYFGHTQMMDELSRLGADFNAINLDGMSIAHLAARGCRVEALSTIEARGVSLERHDYQGRTLLDLAQAESDPISEPESHALRCAETATWIEKRAGDSLGVEFTVN